jgi:hypothetical protein
MRFVIDLELSDDDRVEGLLTRDGWAEHQAFSGWMELIWRLEAAVPRPRPAPRPPDDPEFGRDLA